MKLRNVILIVLIFCLVGFTFSQSGGDDISEDSDCDKRLNNCISSSTENSQSTPTSLSSTTGQTNTPAQTNTPSQSTTGSSNLPNGSGETDQSEDNTTDSPSGTAQPIIKQREKDPYYNKSIGGSYIAYAIGIVCIVFIIVILYKKFRAREVTPIDIDTANYSVLEMRD